MSHNGLKKDLSHYLMKIGYYTLVSTVSLSVLYCIYLLFFPIVGAVLLTFLLEPVVNFFETKGFRRIPVIVGLCMVVLCVSALGAYLVIPKIITETQNLVENLPEYKETAKETLQSLQGSLQAKFPQFDIPDVYQMIKDKAGANGGSIVGSVLSQLSNMASLLSILAIIPVIAFFFLVDGHLMHKAALSLVPNRYFEMFVLLFHKIVTSLKLFLRGQLIDAATVGILTTVGMAVIGLPYSFVIGLIAGVGNLIPYLGPVIGFVPALLVVLMSPEGLTVMWLVKIVIVFVMVQFIEGTFVYPIAVGKSVDLHPLIVIIGITIGGQLAGIVGMLLVIPLISVAKVSLEVLHSHLKSYSII